MEAVIWVYDPHALPSQIQAFASSKVSSPPIIPMMSLPFFEARSICVYWTSVACPGASRYCSWGAEQYLDDPGHATGVQYTQIDLASKKGSDIIGMIGGDDTFDEANAWIWDGSAWGSYTQITASMESPNYRQVALAWESSSGNLLAVAAVASSNDIISKEYSASWSGT